MGLVTAVVIGRGETALILSSADIYIQAGAKGSNAVGYTTTRQTHTPLVVSYQESHFPYFPPAPWGVWEADGRAVRKAAEDSP